MEVDGEQTTSVANQKLETIVKPISGINIRSSL